MAASWSLFFLHLCVLWILCQLPRYSQGLVTCTDVWLCGTEHTQGPVPRAHCAGEPLRWHRAITQIVQNQLLVTSGYYRTCGSAGQRAELQVFEINKRSQSHSLDKDVGGQVRKAEGTGGMNEVMGSGGLDNTQEKRHVRVPGKM